MAGKTTEEVLEAHLTECIEERRNLDRRLAAQDRILDGIQRTVGEIKKTVDESATKRESIYKRLADLEKFDASLQAVNVESLTERLRTVETSLATIAGERAAEGRWRAVILGATATAIAVGIAGLVFG